MNKALGIEDIRRAIGEFMTPSTIIACAQVNSDWHASFIPFIWQSLHFGEPTSRRIYPPLEALEHNKHLVQRLSIQGCLQIPYLSLQGCQQLTHLSLSGSAPCEASRPGRTLVPVPGSPDRYSMWYYWRLLVERHQSSLKSLSISSQQGSTMTVELLKAIAGCTKLETLRLSYASICPIHAGLFWKAISGVETLIWRGGGGDHRGTGGEIPDWIAQELPDGDQAPAPPLVPATGSFISASTNTFAPEPTDRVIPDPLPSYSPSSPPPSRLRRLKISQCLEPATDWQLFQHCKNIRNIEWELLRGDWYFPLEQFGTMLFEGAWPQLEQIEVLNGAETYEDEQWVRLMESPLGPRLKALTVKSSKIGSKTFQVLFAAGERNVQREREGVPSLTAGNISSSAVVGPLAPRPSLNNSLSHINLLPSSDVDSLTIQTILSQLPSLESLSVGRLSYMDIVEGEPWVCKNLKNLTINIDMTLQPLQFSLRRPPSATAEELKAKKLNFANQQRLVFERLSMLTRLNKFTLHQRTGGPKDVVADTRTLDLTLKAGLGLLETWKNMSSLTFMSKHQNMGWPEIRWMVETWPGMRRLTGKFSVDPKMHFELKRYMNKHYVHVFDPPPM
ncbi:hypothetical protein EMPS_00156 [Entomortierella parvispora]|uniref:Uncharacterized protein n=1 Tax=Entomortierella parvispora TaxID=205924 RepID=A0A9P3LRQ2_9FUNG|nr:hypothetical protein EMPS_00156 [Entomortierella parvispora]